MKSVFSFIFLFLNWDLFRAGKRREKVNCTEMKLTFLSNFF